MGSYCEQSCVCCNEKRIERDVFEHCYTLTSGVTLSGVIWSADGIVNPSGSLVLEIESIDTPLVTIDVFLNGNMITPVANLGEGDSIIITSDPLNEIEVAASAMQVTYKLTLCLTINYECC